MTKTLKASAKIYSPKTGKVDALPSKEYSNTDIINYYYISPEVNNIGRSTARTLSRVKFMPTLKNGRPLINANGEYAIDKELADAAIASIERVRGPIGGASQIYGSIGGALGVTADTWLLGYNGDPVTAEPSNGVNSKEMWVTVPRSQINIAGGTNQLEVKFDSKARKPYVIESGYKLIRIWMPSFDNPMQADSWVTPIRSTIERLEYAQQALSASALSQLNAGIIIVPSDQDPAPDAGERQDVIKDAQGNELKPDFPTQLSDHIADFVEDANDMLDGGGRTSPLVVGIDSEVREPKWIEITRSIDAGLLEHIQQLRETIATATPFPVEQLLGSNQAKFYQGTHNTERLDQETFRYVYDPICEIIGDALTNFVLHEDLSEDFSEDEYSQIIVGWDTSKVVSKADNCDKALQLRANGDITREEVRLACGWDAVADGVLEDEEDVDLEKVLPKPVQPALKASAKPESFPLSDIAYDYVNALGIAGDQTIARMHNRAKARLLSATNKSTHKEMHDTIKGISIEQMFSVDGIEQFADDLGENDETLFEAALTELKPQYEKLTKASYKKLAKYLKAEYGIDLDDEQVDSFTKKAWEFLAGALVLEARRTFFGKPRKNDDELEKSVLYGIPSIILKQTSAILGGALASQAALASISSGPFIQGLMSNAGYKLVGHRWNYGDVEDRKFPYVLHLEVDGTFSPPDLSGFNGQAVNDHRGCLCGLEDIYEKEG